jgi:hypothetical protein
MFRFVLHGPDAAILTTLNRGLGRLMVLRLDEIELGTNCSIYCNTSREQH